MAEVIAREHQHLITASMIKRFIQAIGEEHDDARYFDECSNRYRAPTLFCQAIAFDEVPLSDLDSDLSPIEIKCPVPAQRTVGGSSQYEFYLPVWEGDTITVKTMLLSCIKKQGRSGELYLVDVETQFINQQGKAVAREVATYVKR